MQFSAERCLLTNVNLIVLGARRKSGQFDGQGIIRAEADIALQDHQRRAVARIERALKKIEPRPGETAAAGHRTEIHRRAARTDADLTAVIDDVIEEGEGRPTRDDDGARIEILRFAEDVSRTATNIDAATIS